MVKLEDRATEVQRPASVKLAAGLLGFLGVTALGGGITMALDPSGGLIGMPAEWMEPVPMLSDWLVPGVFLATWFGLGSLLTMAGVLMRIPMPGTGRVERWTGRHWSWAATVVLGVTQVTWIGLQLFFMPETMWIQALLAGVGLALVGLMLLPGCRRELESSPDP